MSLYSTLFDVRAEIKVPTATLTAAEDAYVFDTLRRASRRLDILMNAGLNFFVPILESREIQVDMDRVDSYRNTFSLDTPLLSLTAVTLNNAALVVGTDVVAYPSISNPIYRLRLPDYGRSWYPNYFLTSLTAPPTVTITGLWGFHQDYAHAWLLADSLAAAITTSGVNTLTVTNVDQTDDYGHAPAISAGSLLRIDDEYMDVTATNTTTNVVTVRRGVNGSTATTHVISTSVYVYQVEEPVQRAVTRQTAFMYARRGAYETSQTNAMGQINFPADVLAEVAGVLDGYNIV